MTKKYTDIELYLLLREKAQLVEKTKFAVLDKTFKTGCSATNDISIFSLLGLLLDLQSLKVSIFYPNLAKTKVNFEDLTSFIVRNLSKLKYTYRKVNGITNQPLINWMIIGSSSFESQFADADRSAAKSQTSFQQRCVFTPYRHVIHYGCRCTG